MTAAVLQTPRLELRPLTREDGPFVGALISDVQVRRFLGGTVPTAQHAPTLARYLAQDTVWCVWSRHREAPVGLMSITPHHDGADMELSFQMLPRAWGQGYGTEAAGRLRDHALADLGHPRLIAETQAANLASRRLLDRIGFHEDHRVMRFGAEQVIYST